MAVQGLVHGELSRNCIHLCVDMQQLFGPGYPWAVPWLEKVLPAVEDLCGSPHPERILFYALRASRARGRWTQHLAALLQKMAGGHPGEGRRGRGAPHAFA